VHPCKRDLHSLVLGEHGNHNTYIYIHNIYIKISVSSPRHACLCAVYVLTYICAQMWYVCADFSLYICIHAYISLFEQRQMYVKRYTAFEQRNLRTHTTHLYWTNRHLFTTHYNSLYQDLLPQHIHVCTGSSAHVYYCHTELTYIHTELTYIYVRSNTFT